MPFGFRSLHIGPKIGVGIGGVTESTGLQIMLTGGQSNGNGWAFVANQISVVNGCYAYSAVKEVDHNAGAAGDPLVWTVDRPVTLGNTLPSPVGVTPVSLTPRPGDAQGDGSWELSGMRRLDRAQPGRWAFAKMCIPSSSMLNWIAIGSAYPTALPHLIDQWTNYMTFVETVLGGRIAGIVWQQGESDAQTAPLSSAWQTRMTDFIAATRAYLGRTVPFFLPKMHTGAGGTGLATIIAAQSTLASTLSQVYVINTDLIPGGSPGALHYTADQYANAGVIYADRICSVLGINQPPFASFSWAWSTTTVTFTDNSTDRDGTIASWLWDFGDGTTGTTQNPVHVYGALGTYTVRLTVTDNGGATNSVTRLVTCAAGNWTVDAKRGVAIPVDATEWAALMTAAGIAFSPDSARRPGSVAATPIGDDIGAFPQTVAGATVQFQSAHPSMTTLGLRTINNVTDGYSSTDAALPDVLTTSCLKIVVAAVWTVPTSVRGLFSLGTTETSVTFNSSNPQRIVARSNTQNTTGTVDLDNEPHIYFLRHNRTNSTCVCLSDMETINVAFAGSVTGKRERTGLTASPSPGAQFFLDVRFDGAHAELTNAQIKTLGQTMGWVMP